MRYKLKDYQVGAVTEVLKNLDRARQDYHERNDLVAFSLSATTGAGKTVMAATALEALFAGSNEFEVAPDPSAVVLWVTDDPSLNEQTRYRLIESGDQLDAGRLRVIASGFDQERFEPNSVYFLNIQKLASGTSWIKQSDKRNFTLWETIQNTIEDESATLYLVLDEAHRGMKPRSSSEESLRSTIVQRLINGDNGVPPVPIVWGISATVQRFANAMQAAQVEGRITYPAVSVDPKTVQESGLLKDTIILDFPDEKGAFETTLLRAAVRALRESTDLWSAYAEQEALSTPVVPLMVLQVPNRPKGKDVGAMLKVVFEEWPELEGTDAVANVFGEHSDLAVDRYVAPYIAPQDVEGAQDVRILLAKDAISTGWDCPRAEILFSLRPAKDRTHITQLLGRMVRTPLARRIEADERLNAVTCFLPRFDFGKATEVAKVLTGEKPDEAGDSVVGKYSGRKALTSPITMTWNERISTTVADVFASLPSEAVPKAQPKPIRRLLALAAEIAVDGLKSKPNEDALDALFAALDGQLAQHRSEVDALVDDFYTAEIRRITSSVYGSERQDGTYQEKADQRTIDEIFRRSVRTLGAAVANGYTKRLALAAAPEQDEFDIYRNKALLAALVSIDGAVEAIEVEAEQLANSWLNRLRTKIKGLGEDRKVVYDDLKREAREPQRVDPVVPESRIENTRDADNNLLPTRPHHLMADENGSFPVGSLNDWELSVIDTELGRGEFVGWYRNPSAATASAVQVPYQVGTKWKPLQPDFIFFSKKKDGSVAPSIVDPHGTHLADALPKLKGLAAFAKRYPGEFLRIEAVSAVSGKGLRLLDLTDSDVRSAIDEARDAASLYAGDMAQPYE